MNSPAPLLTVAIPTLDRPKYLQETIASVLGQSWAHMEILISDNASGPETESYLATITDPRVRRFRQETRLGMVSHWNACLAKAKGAWFLLLSDDDLLAPHALQDLMEWTGDDSIAMVYSPYITIDSQGTEGMVSQPGRSLSSGGKFIDQHLARRLSVMPSGVLARTRDLRTLGGFPDTGTTSDLAIRLLLATQGQVACLSSPVLSYRLHGTNLSNQVSAVVKSHLDLLHWAEGRRELHVYRSRLAHFVARRVLGQGLRSALRGDADGLESARKGLDDPSLRPFPFLFGRAVAKTLLRLGTFTWFRAAMVIRDAGLGVWKKRL